MTRAGRHDPALLAEWADRVGARVDCQTQPLERQRAAMHDDAVEIRDVVAWMHVVERIGSGERIVRAIRCARTARIRVWCAGPFS